MDGRKVLRRLWAKDLYVYVLGTEGEHRIMRLSFRSSFDVNINTYIRRRRRKWRNRDGG